LNTRSKKRTEGGEKRKRDARKGFASKKSGGTPIVVNLLGCPFLQVRERSRGEKRLRESWGICGERSTGRNPTGAQRLIGPLQIIINRRKGWSVEDGM